MLARLVKESVISTSIPDHKGQHQSPPSFSLSTCEQATIIPSVPTSLPLVQTDQGSSSTACVVRAQTFTFKTLGENCSILTSVFDQTQRVSVEGADTTAVRSLSGHREQSGNGLTATAPRSLPATSTACWLSQLLLFLSLEFCSLLTRAFLTLQNYVLLLLRAQLVQYCLAGRTYNNIL